MALFQNLETLEKKNKIDALCKWAKNPRNKDRAQAVEALRRIGTPEAARALLRLTESDDIAVWEPACRAIARLSDPAVVPALLRGLEEGQHPAPILQALSSIGSPEALNALYKALEDPRLVPEALSVVKQRRESEAVDALEALLLRQLESREENGAVKYLLLSNSLCREVLSALGSMGSVAALRCLHRFLRQRPDAPLRLRIQAGRKLCAMGDEGLYALTGYIGEDCGDEGRVRLLIHSLPNEPLVDTLYENMEGKSADELAQTLIAALPQTDEEFWPRIVSLLERLDRDAARSGLLLWFVQSKAASRDAGYMLARHGDTNPVLVKRLVDMVHLEEQPARKRAGDLLHDLYVDNLIGEEGVRLVRAQLNADGAAVDYSYIGPQV